MNKNLKLNWGIFVITSSIFKYSHLEIIKKILSYNKKFFKTINYIKIPSLNKNIYVKYGDYILEFNLNIYYNTSIYNIFKIISSKISFKFRLYNKIK